MPKTTLEKTVAAAAREFALQIVDAVKAATLQELADLSSAASETAPRRGRKPAAEGAPAPRKRRKRRNYPKCAVPGCDNNRFVRGKGFCGVHWKEFQAGKIGAAETFSTGTEEQQPAETVIKRAGRKTKAASAKVKAAPAEGKTPGIKARKVKGRKAKASKAKASKAKASKAKASKANNRAVKRRVAQKQ